MGIIATGEFYRKDGKFSAKVIKSISKGIPAFERIWGKNSVGPYELRHQNVVYNSEKVRVGKGLNLKKLERDKDYTINYERGWITFQRIITEDELIEVEYEYQPVAGNRLQGLMLETQYKFIKIADAVAEEKDTLKGKRVAGIDIGFNFKPLNLNSSIAQSESARAYNTMTKINFWKFKLSGSYQKVESGFSPIGTGIFPNSRKLELSTQFLFFNFLTISHKWSKEEKEDINIYQQTLSEDFDFKKIKISQKNIWIKQSSDSIYQEEKEHSANFSFSHKFYEVSAGIGRKWLIRDSVRSQTVYNAGFSLNLKLFNFDFSYRHDILYDVYSASAFLNLSFWKLRLTGSLLQSEKRQISFSLQYKILPASWIKVDGNHTAKTQTLYGGSEEFTNRWITSVKPHRIISLQVIPTFSYTISAGNRVKDLSGLRIFVNLSPFKDSKLSFLHFNQRALRFDELNPNRKLYDNYVIQRQILFNYGFGERWGFELQVDSLRKQGLFRFAVASGIPGDTVELYKVERKFEVKSGVVYRGEFLTLRSYYDYVGYFWQLPDSLPTKTKSHGINFEVRRKITDFISTQAIFSFDRTEGQDPFLLQKDKVAIWYNLKIMPGIKANFKGVNFELSHSYCYSTGGLRRTLEETQIKITSKIKRINLNLKGRYAKSSRPVYKTLELRADLRVDLTI